jgi:hypothetical protein
MDEDRLNPTHPGLNLEENLEFSAISMESEDGTCRDHENHHRLSCIRREAAKPGYTPGSFHLLGQKVRMSSDLGEITGLTDRQHELH